uniref:Uncharacterized protein n=1 Tax=Cacopsylla melanoneura TaxID=428564 RepID=A0A8D8QX44_9HEMI
MEEKFVGLNLHERKNHRRKSYTTSFSYAIFSSMKVFVYEVLLHECLNKKILFFFWLDIKYHVGFSGTIHTGGESPPGQANHHPSTGKINMKISAPQRVQVNPGLANFRDGLKTQFSRLLIVR